MHGSTVLPDVVGTSGAKVTSFCKLLSSQVKPLPLGLLLVVIVFAIVAVELKKD